MRRLALFAFLAFLAVLTACNPVFQWSHHQGTIRDGGQGTIDSGAVTNYNGCHPDGGCTVWLAGHRSTSGSVFHDVPNLGVGSEVRIVHDRHTHHYRVTGADIASSGASPDGYIYGDLVIQTSCGGYTGGLCAAGGGARGSVVLVYAEQFWLEKF